MKHVVSLVLIGLGLCMMLNGIASTALQLNQGEVVIDQQSPAALHKAMPKAMGQVLVKLSGNSAVLTIPEIHSQLAQAREMVTSYRYITEKMAKGKQLQVIVTFNQAALTELLQQSGQTIWASHRPTILFWIQEQQSTGWDVVSADGAATAWNDVTRVARERGIPTLFPIMDLQDQSVSAAVYRDDLSLSHALMQRYGVTSLVFATISQGTGGQWIGEWALRLNDQDMTWQDRQATEDALLTAGVNRVADMMVSASVMANGGFGSQGVSIRVSGVADLVDYADVVAYLKTLNVVKSAVVKDMQGATLLVSLEISGSSQRLEDTLAQGQRLFKISAPMSVREGGVDTLYYSWGRPAVADMLPVPQVPQSLVSQPPVSQSSVSQSSGVLSPDDDGSVATQDHAVVHGLGQSPMNVFSAEAST